MSNKLKNFISDNRKAFDDEMPSHKVWDNIEASLTGKQKKKSMLTPLYKWSIAAAAVLLIAVSVYFMTNKKQDGKTEIVKTTEPDINKIAPDAAPEMMHITKMIDAKQEELKVLAKDQPELYLQFTTAINQLDSSYNSLKNQLSATPNKEMLLEAMIQNLQLQLDVLNQQLNIINQIKESKKYSHEKNA